MAAPYIAIVADDLTGSGDTAVQFVRVGWRTQLSVGRAAQALSDPQLSRADVIAVTTHTRPLPADEAAAIVREDVLALQAAGVARLYKKVDSTLRGPFLAEIDAAREAWCPDAVAVVCPAFPAQGRTLENGVLLVDGKPVSETSVGSDPVTPVTESHVPTLLRSAHIAPSAGESAEELAERIMAAGDTVVVDAATEEDIEHLAAAICAMGQRALPVGSGGLAHPLARLWAADDARGPVVVVVTSQHSASRQQADALTRAGAVCWTPALDELADDDAWRSYSARIMSEAREASTKATWLLLAPQGLRSGLDADTVAKRLGELAARLITQCKASGVVATGGDGASAVLNALNAVGIALVGEVNSGVPIGTLTGGQMPGLPVVTKAGGFGEPDVLIKAARAVRERRFSI